MKTSTDRILVTHDPLEAAALAHLQDSANKIQGDSLDSLISSAGMPEEIAQRFQRGEPVRNEIDAESQKEGFIQNLWNKCKSVVNSKAKSAAGSWLGGDDD